MPDGAGAADWGAHLRVPDPRRGWRMQKFAHGTLCAAGDPKAERIARSFFESGLMPRAGELAAQLSAVRGSWALLAETQDYAFAAVDHIRGIPVFFARTPDGVLVGDDAEAVAAGTAENGIDWQAAEELAMAGYAIGNRTLTAGLLQMTAGQVAVWSAGGEDVAFHHDYRPVDHDAASVAPTALGRALDAAFDRLIGAADKRPIVVPLSGGLDSRLVLAKLVERNYPALCAISYGPARNSDAEIARQVAERLGVSWSFIGVSGEGIRAFFGSEERKDYWQFATGRSSAPNMQDVLPLQIMRDDGSLPDETLIVNGQTGDFISGGHIPSRLADGRALDAIDVSDAVIAEHFSLWQSMLTPTRRSTLRARLSERLSLGSGAVSPASAASAFERFEYQERQAKYVVNGQRAYEWHGLSWQLPLWDRDIVDVFESAPFADRFGQSLYRRYLHEWDYRGVFRDVTRTVTAWPKLASAIIVPAALAVRLAAGRERRDRLFRYLNYFDRFGDHYKTFGFKTFARCAHDMRNPASLYVKAWLAENGVSIEELARAGQA